VADWVAVQVSPSLYGVFCTELHSSLVFFIRCRKPHTFIAARGSRRSRALLSLLDISYLLSHVVSIIASSLAFGKAPMVDLRLMLHFGLLPFTVDDWPGICRQPHQLQPAIALTHLADARLRRRKELVARHVPFFVRKMHFG